MKKKILAYFSGVFATVLVLTMVTTALAASGKATFNFVNVSLRGERKIAAGADITVANGQKVPSSILYTDEKGGERPITCRSVLSASCLAWKLNTILPQRQCGLRNSRPL